MSGFFDSFTESLTVSKFVEITAVSLSVIYVILIAFKNKLGWIFAFFASLLYVYLSYEVKLYAESVLQFFYVFLAVYGWYSWNKSAATGSLIIRIKINRHFFIISTGILSSVILGYLMNRFTEQALPYFNAITTVFSLIATYLATKRVLENWIYWIVIDVALCVLYSKQDLNLIGVNYMIFSIIAFFAYFSWQKKFKNQV